MTYNADDIAILRGLEAVRRSIPFGRFADPGELAALIAFLVSDEARYITGTVLPVDAGSVNKR